jgi:hypothetical protein
MSLYQSVITLGTATASQISPTGTFTAASFSVQNQHATAIVYVGDSTVTASSYAHKMNPGDVLAFDNLSSLTNMAVYAISNTASTPVGVINIIR